MKNRAELRRGSGIARISAFQKQPPCWVVLGMILCDSLSVLMTTWVRSETIEAAAFRLCYGVYNPEQGRYELYRFRDLFAVLFAETPVGYVRWRTDDRKKSPTWKFIRGGDMFYGGDHR
jgi:hypothetical protein